MLEMLECDEERILGFECVKSDDIYIPRWATGLPGITPYSPPF
jgi:hypothetical protein